MRYFIGLDAGATKIEGILVNEKGKVLDSEEILTPKRKKEFLEAIFDLIKGLKSKKVSGIGIGMPGQVFNRKVIKLPNLPEIKNFDLAGAVERKFKIKTKVENDAACFALAEARSRKKENLVGLTLGSGLGGGIIIKGQIYRGADGLAGEFGQIYYKSGIFEDYCSGKFFEKKNLSRKNYAAFGRYLGRLVHIVVDSFNPEMIVLGGSISESFNLFKKAMEKSFKSKLTYPQLKKTKIVASRNKKAGAIGAAFLHSLKNF